MEISEFVNAMKEVNANLTDNELQMLWRYIDRSSMALKHFSHLPAG